MWGCYTNIKSFSSTNFLKYSLTVAAAFFIVTPAISCNEASNSINITLNAPDYKLTKDSSGLDLIQIEGFASTISQGDPILPRNTYNIAVPPDTVLSSLNMKILSAKTTFLPGTYNIPPAPAFAAQQGEDKEKDIRDGKNIKIYETDADYPADYINMLPYSQMRKWKFAKLEFTPFQYNPVAKKLTLIQSVTIELNFKQSPSEIDDNLMKDTSMDKTAAETFFNYDQAKIWYLK